MNERTAATLRSLGAALAGFLAYGGWAFFVNQSHGQDMGLRAGLTQGSYSFLLTLTTTYLMEYLLMLFADLPGRRFVPIAVTVAITFATAYGINWIMGTPEILLTILPGFIIGAVYTVSYVMALTTLKAST